LSLLPTIAKSIMKSFNPEIDHIDPQWKEGRDYQLVCGLDLPCNYREVSRAENTSKNNRFLPYRVGKDSLGSTPEQSGDLCLFLDPDTEEWVLEEFLGEWWYAKTDRFAGGCRALEEYRKTNLETQINVLRTWQKNNPSECVKRQWETLRSNPELLDRRNANIGEGVRRRNKENPEILERASAKIREAKARRFQCLITGYIGNGSAVSQHQIRHGINHKDPANRIQLT
jgi:hypothetical protein